MRRLALAAGILVLGACPDDGPRGLAVAINNVQLTIDRADPDGLANLELNVELDARQEPAEVTAEEVTVSSLPDGAVEVAISPRLLGPQGEVSSVGLAADELLNVRLLNGSLTNAQAMDLCDRPAEVTVVMADFGNEVEDSRDVNVTCRN